MTKHNIFAEIEAELRTVALRQVGDKEQLRNKKVEITRVKYLPDHDHDFEDYFDITMILGDFRLYFRLSFMITNNHLKLLSPELSKETIDQMYASADPSIYIGLDGTHYDTREALEKIFMKTEESIL